MNIGEIKAAVDAGKRVHWMNAGYVVIRDSRGQYLITHERGSCIALTWKDEATLNGKEHEFFVA